MDNGSRGRQAQGSGESPSFQNGEKRCSGRLKTCWFFRFLLNPGESFILLFLTIELEAHTQERVVEVQMTACTSVAERKSDETIMKVEQPSFTGCLQPLLPAANRRQRRYVASSDAHTLMIFGSEA